MNLLKIPEDIFYLIIAAAWFIYKSYTKAKKGEIKPQPMPSFPYKGGEKKTTLEKWEEILEGKVPAAEEIPVPRPSSLVLRPAVKKEVVAQKTIKKDKEIATPVKKLPLAEVPVTTDEGEYFDLRQAIIWSEILKRPAY